VRVIKKRADSGSIVGKRDLAMLLLYFVTAMRRREVAQLRWGNVKINDIITLTGEVKGDKTSNKVAARLGL
jgi:integrase